MKRDYKICIKVIFLLVLFCVQLEAKDLYLGQLSFNNMPASSDTLLLRSFVQGAFAQDVRAMEKAADQLTQYSVKVSGDPTIESNAKKLYQALLDLQVSNTFKVGSNANNLAVQLLNDISGRFKLKSTREPGRVQKLSSRPRKKKEIISAQPEPKSEVRYSEENPLEMSALPLDVTEGASLGDNEGFEAVESEQTKEFSATQELKGGEKESFLNRVFSFARRAPKKQEMKNMAEVDVEDVSLAIERVETKKPIRPTRLTEKEIMVGSGFFKKGEAKIIKEAEAKTALALFPDMRIEDTDLFVFDVIYKAKDNKQEAMQFKARFGSEQATDMLKRLEQFAKQSSSRSSSWIFSNKYSGAAIDLFSKVKESYAQAISSMRRVITGSEEVQARKVRVLQTIRTLKYLEEKYESELEAFEKAKMLSQTVMNKSDSFYKEFASCTQNLITSFKTTRGYWQKLGTMLEMQQARPLLVFIQRKKEFEISLRNFLSNKKSEELKPRGEDPLSEDDFEEMKVEKKEK